MPDQTRGESSSRILCLVNKLTSRALEGGYIYRGEPRSHDKVSSSLYRRYEESVESTNFDIEFVQAEILRDAERYTRFTGESTEIEILSQLRHHGGDTNLIDFTTDVLVALYFACDGGSGEDGRVILLSKTGADYHLEEPSSPAHRVLAQKSIFVRPHRGFADPDHIVIVPSDLKWNLLDYLRDCHDISTATVYNDLNGFIRHQGIHRSAYTEFYQGMACQQIEDYRRAIEHYDRALELNPQMAAAFNNRGVAYDSIGKHWRAIEDYDRSLELNPSDAGVYDNRGVAYAHIGIHGQAIQSYSKAIELDHDRAATFANRGESWLHLGEWENAMQDLAKAEGMGCDIARSFHNDYDDITEFQDKTGWQMPQNIAEMLSY